MTQPATYAIAWTREAAIETLNERRLELGWSLIQLDDAAEQAAGTAGKYLGPSCTKGLGLDSLLKMSRGLGLRVVFEVDPAATEKLVEQSTSRRANQAREGNHAQQLSKRVLGRVSRHLAKLSIAARMEKVAPEERRAIARHAAMKRWYPERKDEAVRAGKKRRGKEMKRRARQRVATHKARLPEKDQNRRENQ